jgi:hypothetical protein
MAQDKSIILVPPISFINNTLISASPIDTNQTNTNIDGYTDVKRLTNIEAEITKELEDTRDRGANAATVQSSDGGSGPTGLGDTLDNAPDNSRLGGSNSGGGTPNF